MGEKSTKVKPDLPLTTRFLISVYTFISKSCVRSDGTINRRLFSLLDRKLPAPATKLFNKTPVSTSDISVDPSHSLWFRLFVPGNDWSSKKLPLIIFFHGGGFSQFGPGSSPYNNLCCHLAAKVPAIVASINYRLAPEHRFPCPYEDGFDTLKYIDSNAHDLLPSNTDLEKCFIAGDSAGGNIAHHITVRACKNYQEFEKFKIIGLLLMQPFFGGEERTESELRLTGGEALMIDVERTDRMWKNFLPEGSDRDHEAANVFGGGPNSKAPEIENLEFPSTLLFVGGFDPLQDWQRKYFEGLRRCGKEVKLVEYPNAIHGFYVFPQLPDMVLFWNEIKEFIQKKIETSSKKEEIDDVHHWAV